MEPFEVYKLYLAVKLHFTKKDYDIIKYRGKVRIKEETYKKRKDLVSIKKLARDYTREEVINFLIVTLFLVKGGVGCLILMPSQIQRVVC